MSEFESLKRDISLINHDTVEVEGGITKAIHLQGHPSHVSLDIDLYRRIMSVVSSAEELVEKHEELKQDNDHMHDMYDGVTPPPPRWMPLQ